MWLLQLNATVAARVARYRLVWIVGSFTVASLILAACGGASDANDRSDAMIAAITSDASSYTDVDPASLAQMLEQEDLTLVNVHVPYEGEIADTDAFIPYNEIDQDLVVLPVDRSAKIVLYCHGGRMSEIAAGTLVTLGYVNIWNMDGGMIAWEGAGFPLANQPATLRSPH